MTSLFSYDVGYFQATISFEISKLFISGRISLKISSGSKF